MYIYTHKVGRHQCIPQFHGDSSHKYVDSKIKKNPTVLALRSDESNVAFGKIIPFGSGMFQPRFDDTGGMFDFSAGYVMC